MKKIYSYFSRILTISYSEARSFFSLLVVCVIALLVMFLHGIFTNDQKGVDPEDVKKLDSLEAILLNPGEHLHFSFDPNTLPIDSLQLLGIPQKVAERLVNYRTKGGKFRFKSDVKKFYGLEDEWYKNIETYIILPDSLISRNNAKLKIDINNAGKDDFQDIDEIGSVIANRIIRYRMLLGGFLSKEQLSEVYQLDGSALINLKKQTYISTSFQPIKIMINKASMEELMAHPISLNNWLKTLSDLEK